MSLINQNSPIEGPSSLTDILNLYGDLPVCSIQINQSIDEYPSFVIEGRYIPKKQERSDGMFLNEWPTSTFDDKYSSITNSTDLAEILKKYSNVGQVTDKCCCTGSTTTGNSKKTSKDDSTKGEEKTMDIFNGMFGKVANGMCRLSLYGGIAVKTSTGYKTYNLKKKRLTNCSNFVFDVGQEYFFVIPTNKVEPGDIILIAGKPKCVISVNDETITVINYEDSVVEQILPERHVFMGNTYFYGKIVSMFGNDILGNGKKGMNKLMSYMMLSELMKGMNGSGNQNAMNSMLPFLMMSGGNMNDLFSDIFNFEEEDEDVNDCSDIEDGAKTE